MAAWRYTTQEPCPIDDSPVKMAACQLCRYFRGASSTHHERRGWQVNCNWPRDGMHIAVEGEGREGPGIERAMGGGSIPPIFLAALDEEAAA